MTKTLRACNAALEKEARKQIKNVEECVPKEGVSGRKGTGKRTNESWRTMKRAN